jgi:hypothetical protein
LSLNAQTSQGLKAVGLQIGFDPESLKAVDVVEGDSLKRGAVQSSMKKHIDQSGGNITADLAGAGSTGTASVVTLTFEVIAAAQGTTVSIDSISATDANGEAVSLTAPEPHIITLTQ